MPSLFDKFLKKAINNPPGAEKEYSTKSIHKQSMLDAVFIISIADLCGPNNFLIPINPYRLR